MWLFSLLLINERTNDDDDDDDALVFRMLFASFYRAAVPSRRVVSRADRVLVADLRYSPRLKRSESSLQLRACTYGTACAYGVFGTKRSQNAKPEQKLHTLLYENASSPKAQRDSVHVEDGTGTRWWMVVVS